ncbi:T9SS type A sorting domain-containing protein [Lewinella cohaerens]|uniref:T9SS type A sorting domain-containing protein n=1 Tax=Lewinella cohaerens TaxID=70995 RepID=UPI0003A4963F|nr:T9SS type A sorting domain-containing protein [Lewinella cohaerens]
MQFNLLFCLIILSSTLLPAQVIFPGDLNNDGTANFLDLLPLGVAYGQTGPMRFEATLNWQPQEAEPWALNLPVSGVNLVSVDADGNGVIDSLDLDAIAFNYDSIQVLSLPPPQPYLLTDTFPVEERPTLELRFNRTEVAAGDTVEVTIFLNIPDPTVFPPTNPPTAIACRISFDPTMINEASTRFLAAEDSEDLMFIGAGTNNVDFGRSPLSGQLEFAAAGRGQGALAMSRPVGKFIIVIEDMILLEGSPGIDIDNALLINLFEQVIDVQVETDTLLVVETQTPIPTSAALEAFPNPCQKSVEICGLNSQTQTLEMFDSQGRLLRTFQQVGQDCQQISMENFPAGTYFLRTQSLRNYETLKLIKQVK